jgi:hypothetical protein
MFSYLLQYCALMRASQELQNLHKYYLTALKYHNQQPPSLRLCRRLILDSEVTSTDTADTNLRSAINQDHQLLIFYYFLKLNYSSSLRDYFISIGASYLWSQQEYKYLTKLSVYILVRLKFYHYLMFSSLMVSYHWIITIANHLYRW